MAAEQPALTVLQLDTGFTRVPGDVACPATYRAPVEILRVPRATVGRIVTDRPETIDLAPFEAAAARARGQLVTTSCGFLAPFQTRLAACTGAPFLASAMIALPDLLTRYAPDRILVFTFDAASLTVAHTGGERGFDVVGLRRESYLRRVIATDLPDLDPQVAGAEVTALLRQALLPRHRHILLECTNLPPYKSGLRAITDLPITDILTCIEAARPGTVDAAFL